MEITLSYNAYTKADLSSEDLELFEAAESARGKAYAPYSNFTVGCALRLANGEIVTGNNQENAAYPSGLCAERVALFTAGAVGQTPIEALMVVAKNAQGEIADAFPCGACRQVILEYDVKQDQPIRVLIQASDQQFLEVEDSKSLLPFAFSSKTL